jgi:glycosyltransferase involved in cell wall biosynthesis
MIGHCGWGEVLFVKDVWPNVPLLGYFEFFYRVSGSDLDFDPEFPATTIEPTRIRTRNTINLLSLDAANWGQTPTEWQRAQYPEIHRSRISVIHEGIDTDLVHPEPSARLWLRGGASFAPGDEIITYSARNLEPYRGFHTFMRSLAKVLERRPNARAIIVGADGVSYGRLPERAANWREYMLTELEGRLDLRRVSFVGWLPYQQYLAVLQLLLGAYLSDLSLCAVVVALGGDGGGVCGHRLAHPAGRGGDRRHEQRLSRRLFRCRRAGGTDLRGIARSRRHCAHSGPGAAARGREL